jgi:3-methyladenine DNA glycosylase AlkC
MLVTELLQRKGATRVDAVPPQVLAALEAGLICSVNLTEFLAVRPGRLLSAVLQSLSLDAIHAPDDEQLASIKPMQRHRFIAAWLYDAIQPHPQRDSLAHALATHTSDAVRQWAVLWLERVPEMTLAQRLDAVRPFAADTHFGVREIAWMAVRPAITANLPQALKLFESWVTHDDPNVRRFATESTRPRGVWCAHIDALKSNPSMALAVLEPLRADPSKYVRDSVANWLNDASKSQPEWVAALCERWLRDSDCAATRSLVQRALRTLDAA